MPKIDTTIARKATSAMPAVFLVLNVPLRCDCNIAANATHATSAPLSFELELAVARERLEKERSHIVTVIEKVRANGSSDPELERKLADINSAIAQNDYRAANIRAGYVYVISNRGAFGDHVVKIGLTRRLEPLDRIYELGDASVPFRFDVHAIFFSEDAVGLESELHNRFSAYRVNQVNNRKEFFFASPAEVRSVLSEKLGNLLEFAEHAESTEYLQSVRYWPVHIQPPQPSRVTEQ